MYDDDDDDVYRAFILVVHSSFRAIEFASFVTYRIYDTVFIYAPKRVESAPFTPCFLYGGVLMPVSLQQ